MHDKNARQIKKGDYYRVLVTETVPYETPLIFSNDGFYKTCKSSSNDESFFSFLVGRLVYGEGKVKGDFTIPYHYKIRKNLTDFRRLSVLHPISQWQMKLFYEKYEKLICHYCSGSKFSIRSPQRTASVFYFKNSWANIGQYKRGSVDDVGSDQRIKHSSSFYSYRGYDRLYKFFNSRLFLQLEKDFDFLKTLDVSKCFDSIYTHSLAWATKEKQFVKSKLKGATFGNSFDILIRNANYNETNGIVIGPEISRIFAEIIFQDVDIAVESRLSAENLRLGLDYSIKRYVDDVFIFAKTSAMTSRIHQVYTDCLSAYNLHVNAAKSIEYQRPFYTKKSKIVRELNIRVNEFSDKFLMERSNNETLIPKDIYRSDRLIHSFVDSVKSICSSNSVGYDDVSSYLISAFFERAKRLINIERVSLDNGECERYRDAVLAFLELMFFFYSVAPSVSSSYKLCASIILLSRFSEQHLGHYEKTVKLKIYDLSLELLDGDLVSADASVNSFIFLEAMNVILAISEIGRDYMLPPQVIDRFFAKKNSYYDLVVCLFYIKDYPEYNSVRTSILKRIDMQLQDISDIQVDTQKACLFLDSLSCPHIDAKRKRRLVDRFCQVSGKAKLANKDFSDLLESFSKNYWFINWREVDLLNALERKELRQVY